MNIASVKVLVLVLAMLLFFSQFGHASKVFKNTKGWVDADNCTQITYGSAVKTKMDITLKYTVFNDCDTTVKVKGIIKHTCKMTGNTKHMTYMGNTFYVKPGESKVCEDTPLCLGKNGKGILRYH